MKYASLLATVMWMCVLSVNSFGQERHLIPFEISDQFDKVYTDQHYHQKILIVIGSDKAGKAYNPVWSGAIEEALVNLGIRNHVSILGIANLKGVPFFLKGMVKGKLPKDPDNRLLLDWGGEFAKAYKFEDKVCNIIIFDKDGKLAVKTYGKELEPHKLDYIKSKLRELANEENLGQ